MIGIIDNELSAYSIIERIRNKLPKLTIYLYKELIIDINSIIKLFINKDCKIIIVNDKYNIDDLKMKYKNIYFLTLNKLIIENSYIIEDSTLIKAIEEANFIEVTKIIEEMKIDTNKIIVLNNPKLLFIKSIINKIYPNNKIIDNIDILINQIEIIIRENNLSLLEEGNCYIIS